MKTWLLGTGPHIDKDFHDLLCLTFLILVLIKFSLMTNCRSSWFLRALAPGRADINAGHQKVLLTELQAVDRDDDRDFINHYSMNLLTLDFS